MADKLFEKIVEGLREAYDAREYGDPGEAFTQSVLKRVRYVKAREPRRRGTWSEELEFAVSRFASGAAVFAAAVFIYGHTQGLGLTSTTDVMPPEVIKVIALRGGIL